MKFINKNSSPNDFENWKQRNRGANWNDLSNADNRIIKSNLAESLHIEQGKICCYCEQRISGNNSHIEHFKPKSTFPSDSFNYANLLASCEGNPKNKSCGHKKHSEYSNEMVSPLDSKCESRFIYTEHGMMSPSDPDDADAEQTVLTLGLNTRRLKAIRRVLYIEIDNYKMYLSPDDFRQLIDDKLQLKPEGYCEYWTTVNYVALNS
ncbi:MAG: retron system putative HNH endonuclease [Candidatus Electryonea clarkiae]|nr:retron system putative HNH endonuclease [Candidatus Electryonea clarkiae]MDP8286223.1 retron system putative HNH endonuclease [Candidatus Electryonea clarkiae]